jgi:hypothetical protein
LLAEDARKPRLLSEETCLPHSSVCILPPLVPSIQ